MNFAVNKIRYNKSVIHFLAKQGKKKYTKRFFGSESADPNPNNNPFPSWKLIAILSGLGIYHQYQRVYK
jgi:hypothetical protein